GRRRRRRLVGALLEADQSTSHSRWHPRSPGTSRRIRHSMTSPVTIVGAGLAGSECAWQLARRGHRVRVIEMRPKVKTSAHETDRCAELVCSNSFRSDNPRNAVGLLKREMEALDSLIVRSARAAAVPAGDALAMDRHVFAGLVTEAISARPEIEVVREEVREIPAE